MANKYDLFWVEFVTDQKTTDQLLGLVECCSMYCDLGSAPLSLDVLIKCFGGSVSDCFERSSLVRVFCLDQGMYTF